MSRRSRKRHLRRLGKGAAYLSFTAMAAVAGTLVGIGVVLVILMALR